MFNAMHWFRTAILQQRIAAYGPLGATVNPRPPRFPAAVRDGTSMERRRTMPETREPPLLALLILLWWSVQRTTWPYWMRIPYPTRSMCCTTMCTIPTTLQLLALRHKEPKVQPWWTKTIKLSTLQMRMNLEVTPSSMNWMMRAPR